MGPAGHFLKGQEKAAWIFPGFVVGPGSCLPDMAHQRRGAGSDDKFNVGQGTEELLECRRYGEDDLRHPVEEGHSDFGRYLNICKHIFCQLILMTFSRLSLIKVKMFRRPRLVSLFHEGHLMLKYEY
jgi:hypothetical protein